MKKQMVAQGSKKMEQIKAPKVANVRCKTEAECKAIGDTLRDSYAKGKRFRKVGFSKAKG